jgi:hypothetical protein
MVTLLLASFSPNEQESIAKPCFIDSSTTGSDVKVLESAKENKPNLIKLKSKQIQKKRIKEKFLLTSSAKEIKKPKMPKKPKKTKILKNILEKSLKRNQLKAFEKEKSPSFLRLKK